MRKINPSIKKVLGSLPDSQPTALQINILSTYNNDNTIEIEEFEGRLKFVTTKEIEILMTFYSYLIPHSPDISPLEGLTHTAFHKHIKYS